MLSANGINQDYDLLALLQKDTALRKSGDWFYGPCPFCGGRDRFVVKKTSNGWRWYCRKCSDDKYRTSIDYVMQKDHLSFTDALHRLTDPVYLPCQIENPEMPTPSVKTPANSSVDWQTKVDHLVEFAAVQLFKRDGEKALDYLQSRGIKPATLRKYHIGYSPSERFEDLSDWGLPDPTNGKHHSVWIPRGIVIPCIAANENWYVKIRRPVAELQVSRGEQKYIKIKGSKPGIFGVENFRGAWLAFLTEGEFDCMILDQEAGDLAGVATLGSATDRLERIDLSVWGKYLLPIAHILTVFDNDPEGVKGSVALAGFSSRIKIAALPKMNEVKDVTDLWKTGRNLGEWVARTVEKCNIDISDFFNLAVTNLGVSVTEIAINAQREAVDSNINV